MRKIILENTFLNFQFKFKAILKSGSKKLVGDQTNDSKIEELFEKIDDNEDKKVSKKEFVENCMNNVFLKNILLAEFTDSK